MVELHAIGVCGSDLHYWRMGRIGDQVVRFPLRLGHEAAGEVVETGPGARRVRAGWKVAVDPGISCGACRECRLGRANLCPHVLFLGTPPVNGCFQRYLVMPEECLEVLPEGVSVSLGAAAEPLGVAMQGFDLLGLRAGENVAVVGAGPVGLCAIALARSMGARVVAAAEPRPRRQAAAGALGAERVIGAVGGEGTERFAQAVREATAGVGAEFVVECSGAPESFDACVAAAARGGKVALVGITEEDRVSLDPHAWRRRELLAANVRRSNRTLARCLRLFENSDLGLTKAGFFSRRIGLPGLQAAFEDLDRQETEQVKLIVDPRL